ncbi:MAG: hypothetical protein E5Y02_16555 [Mesorhizobium sp.]|nr:MAG: hypothetical protein E5Y02_16555 [Mesorhizobium sp.]
MLSRAAKIVSDNNKTFYDYRTGKRQNISWRIFLAIIVSVVLALIVNSDDGTFVEAIITLFAILIGFSFSVMFYLVSAPQDARETGLSLERQVMQAKLSDLSKEIFQNISYFNLVSVICLTIAITIIMSVDRGRVAEYFSCIEEMLRGIISILPQTVGKIMLWAKFVQESVFYFLMIESAYTFSRVVIRVNYMFEEKLRLQSNLATDAESRAG